MAKLTQKWRILGISRGKPDGLSPGGLTCVKCSKDSGRNSCRMGTGALLRRGWDASNQLHVWLPLLFLFSRI